MLTREQFGRIVAIQQKDLTWKRYRIANISQAQCTLTDHSIGHYIVGINIADPTDVTDLHPDHLEELFIKGTETAYIEDSQVFDQQPQPEVHALPSKKITKKERAIKLLEELTIDGASKATIINIFMEQLDMTRSGAQTYYYNLRKERK